MIELMKHGLTIALIFLLAACSTNDDTPDLYTGEEVTYQLEPGSQFPISGTITFKERINGDLEALIKLSGTEGAIYHPTHLHYGDKTTPDAQMAALLNPVYGKTGESITIFNKLGDETLFGFAELLSFEGHIKVHQDDGSNSNVILAIGNVGAAAN